MERERTSSKASLALIDRIADQRMHAAGTRALASLQNVKDKAERLCEEMDDLTPLHGVPIRDLSDEDSAVIAINEVIANNGGAKR